MNGELINAEKDLDETYWWFVGRRALLERVLGRFGKRRRKAVDIGCGSGRNLQLLSHFADWVMGVDRSSAALKLAASHGFPTARGDGQAIPLADCSVDLLSALDVLEHLDDGMGALTSSTEFCGLTGFCWSPFPLTGFFGASTTRP